MIKARDIPVYCMECLNQKLMSYLCSRPSNLTWKANRSWGTLHTEQWRTLEYIHSACIFLKARHKTSQQFFEIATYSQTWKADSLCRKRATGLNSLSNRNIHQYTEWFRKLIQKKGRFENVWVMYQCKLNRAKKHRRLAVCLPGLLLIIDFNKTTTESGLHGGNLVHWAGSCVSAALDSWMLSTAPQTESPIMLNKILTNCVAFKHNIE